MNRLAGPSADRDTTVVSTADLVDGLVELGIEPGALVLVHASLSAFGLVAGGEQAVVQALRTAVGAFGTITMPTQSWQLCDPDFLDDPGLGGELRARVRDALPVYDERLTPTRSMGRVAELFRLQPDVLRSPHPHRSFAAAGLEAREITKIHPRESPFGESSPLARLFDLDAQVLLLGVGFDKCTALHLAEGRAAAGRCRSSVRNGTAVEIDGARRWLTWDEPRVDDGDFVAIGDAFGATGGVRTTRVGRALCQTMSMVELVDFAVQTMNVRSSF